MLTSIELTVIVIFGFIVGYRRWRDKDRDTENELQRESTAKDWVFGQC